MAGKRIVALILVLVMAVQAFACGKPSDDVEEEVKQPYSYKKYVCYKYPGNDNVKKTLIEEYENLITERTKKLYDQDSGELFSITKWYYDETGSQLLKQVNWSKGLSESYEYDTKGRLIRQSRKFEDSDNDHSQGNQYSALSIPEECFRFSKKLDLKMGADFDLMKFPLDSSVTELVTEYSYKDDTEHYESISTFDNNGNEVFSLRLGDEDVILGLYITGEGNRYWETYYSDVRSVSAGTYESGNLVITLTREYDETGRCRKEEAEIQRPNAENSRIEILFEYDTDGYVQNFTVYNGEKVTLRKSERYNNSDLLLWTERRESSTDTDMGSEIVNRTSYTYHENGMLATMQQEISFDGGVNTSKTIGSYDEEGNWIMSAYYTSDGELSEKISTEITKEQTELGNVRHDREYRLSSGPGTETDYVYLPSMEDPDRMEWVTFYEKEVSLGRDHVYINAEAEYTNDGKLKRVEYYFESPSVEEGRLNGYTFREFDEKGRTVMYGTQVAEKDVALNGYESMYYVWEFSDP